MRIALFFDGNNFYRALRSQYTNWEIQYEQLADWVVQSIDENARMTGAYYYTGFSESSGLDRFLGGLEIKRGFFVRREPIVERESSCPHCKGTMHYQVEKRVDTRLVAEMVQLAARDTFDAAVVFSGDEDLVPALEAVNSFGKPVYVATWGGHCLSRSMRVHCYDIIDLRAGLQHFAILKEPEQQNEIAQDLLAQLIEAWTYFNGRDGLVTRWYFENKWKPTGPCPPPGTPRQEQLDVLIQTGQVETFETSLNGRVVLALRPRKSCRG